MEIQKEKWQIELESGNIWRAKEILRSNIRYIYDLDIYLAYGKILYDVKDYYEAGKYLFIAGEPIDGEYKDAIDIFLKRHEHTYISQLISNFPRKFVQENFDNYPITVQEYIRHRGYEKKDIDKFKKDNQYVQIDSDSSLLGNILGILLMGLFLLIFVAGVTSIIEWLMNFTLFFESDKCVDAGGIWDENLSSCNITY